MAGQLKFACGARVRVSDDHHWAAGAGGIITTYPSFISETATGELVNETTMAVPTLQGIVYQSWVTFEEPQHDSDGNGPYAAGMIDNSALASLQ